MHAPAPTLDDDARELLGCHDDARTVQRHRLGAIGELDRAEAVAQRIVQIREQRGETAVGWKIGFTNRALWPLYGVHAPIWAPVWDSTLVEVPAGAVQLPAGRFVAPRLEPEVVLGLAQAPAGTDVEALAAALGWIAHGLEVVHCPWPDWKFSAAQAFAAQSLHGALLLGSRVPVATFLAGRPRAALPEALSALRVSLRRDGEPVAEGTGAAVLDGPLQALSHLAQALAARGERLAAGTLVTTGTLTDAQPLVAGQTWETRFDGEALPGLALRAID